MLKVFGAAVVPASATGASAAAQTAIGSLVERDGVTIEGEVTQVFGNNFVVSDGSGSMLVKTGPSWFHDVRMQVGERVGVTGELDDGAMDAFSIRRAGGEEIDIRPAGGPPPWAGGRRG